MQKDKRINAKGGEQRARKGTERRAKGAEQESRELTANGEEQGALALSSELCFL